MAAGPRRRWCAPLSSFAAVLAFSSLFLGCHHEHEQTARVTIRSAAGPPLRIDEPPPLRAERVVARVRATALATDIDRVYFGDPALDQLTAARKSGGHRIVRI